MAVRQRLNRQYMREHLPALYEESKLKAKTYRDRYNQKHPRPNGGSGKLGRPQTCFCEACPKCRIRLQMRRFRAARKKT